MKKCITDKPYTNSDPSHFLKEKGVRNIKRFFVLMENIAE